MVGRWLVPDRQVVGEWKKVAGNQLNFIDAVDRHKVARGPKPGGTVA